MKPPPFEYCCPQSLDEALTALAEAGEDGKLLAGGQSLVPMMNLRLVRPAMLIDLNGLDDQRYLRFGADELRVGLLARHVDFETSAEVADRLPILARVVKDIAHRAIRNRGTFAGSLSHNDPAAEWPLMAVLLDAQIDVRSAKAERRITAREFFLGYLETALDDDEIVTEVTLPIPDASFGWGFVEISRRQGDFAMASVGALVRLEGGRIGEARIALGGVGACAYRASAAEEHLAGEAPSAALWASTAEVVRELVDPPGDLHASEDFRRHLIGEICQRALADATKRAQAS